MTTELSVPKGHGIVRVAHNLRHHVVKAQDWNRSAGTDFWLLSEAEYAGAANDDLITNFGWTTTTIALASPTGADFASSDGVGTPNSLLFGDDTDLLQSPTIFGDYAHVLMAGQFLGRLPTRLIVEVYAAFTTNSGSETRTGFGLTEAGGTSGTANDAMAWIHIPDGANFAIRSGADSDTGSADDANFHQFRIVVSVGTTDKIEWFIDGTSQGTMDSQDNLWPCSFGAYTSTNNRISLAFAHLWYE
jgi:hypothetical protein